MTIAPHPYWVGTVKQGSGLLGTTMKIYSSKWGGNQYTGGKHSNINKAKSMIGKIGKGLVGIGAAARLIEYSNNIETMRTAEERNDELADAALDIAFGAMALIPGPWQIVSLTYFIVDNFVLDKGVYRTVAHAVRREDE